ncbi:MAG: guanylate kinase [Phycisphaerales bacterium]
MAQAKNPTKRTRGKLIVISGPSGVGKSTITKAVISRLKDAYLSVSMTTRPQAPGEQDGREYWFVSRDEFRKRIEAGLFLEHAEVFGNLYGTPRDKTEVALQAGRTVILEIDVQGGRQVKAIFPRAVMIFVLPPNRETLADRIGRRGRESGEVVARRLRAAESEIAAAAEWYENKVVNDDLERAIDDVIRIVENAPDA